MLHKDTTKVIEEDVDFLVSEDEACLLPRRCLVTLLTPRFEHEENFVAMLCGTTNVIEEDLHHVGSVSCSVFFSHADKISVSLSNVEQPQVIFRD